MSTLNTDIAAAPGRVPALDLISVLRGKSPRLAMAIAAGQVLLPAARAARVRYRANSAYTVKVPGSDDLYDDLHEWVLGLLPPSSQRALVAWTSHPGMLGAIAMDSDSTQVSPSLRLRYDGAREQPVTVAGHRIRVMVTDGTPGGSGDGKSWKPPEIVFTASSAAARDALLAEIGRVLDGGKDRQRKPSFRMLNSWGEWARLDSLPERTPESVILPAGQMERLLADVSRFLAAESEYARRCIPWHRGHLYEGPPGTGKTSVARAVASHFGMDVWYLPLADVQKDSSLLQLASRIGPRSMLLLEDADVFHATTKRDDDAGTVTLSGLLNALDGIATPHGLLTVLTTNSPDSLDEAVMRPGRVDLAEHFGYADPGQVSRIISRWYGITAEIQVDVYKLTPAAVIEACKRHDDPSAAIADLLGQRSPA